MGQAIRKFVPRAPRYVLQPRDNRVLRYGSEKDQHTPHKTNVVDLSETGLAYLVDRECAPQIGDMIRLEFTIPHQNTVSWWGRVTRITEYDPAPYQVAHRNEDGSAADEVLIGVEFHNVDENQRLKIREGLAERLQQLDQQRRQERWQALAYWFQKYAVRTTLILAVLVVTLGVLYALSRPGPNYDPERGSPWGQRYPWLNFFSD